MCQIPPDTQLYSLTQVTGPTHLSPPCVSPLQSASVTLRANNNNPTPQASRNTPEGPYHEPGRLLDVLRGNGEEQDRHQSKQQQSQRDEGESGALSHDVKVTRASLLWKRERRPDRRG